MNLFQAEVFLAFRIEAFGPIVAVAFLVVHQVHRKNFVNVYRAWKVERIAFVLEMLVAFRV